MAGVAEAGGAGKGATDITGAAGGRGLVPAGAGGGGGAGVPGGGGSTWAPALAAASSALRVSA